MSGNEDFMIENGFLHRYNGPGGDVVIPEGVIAIGNFAFSDCEGLTSVTIPDGVREINSYAFYGRTSLAGVTIPNSVKEIGDSAFRDCESLTSVAIPNSVKKIGYYAFSGCTSLTSVEIAPEHPQFYMENGLVISRKERSVILVPGGLTNVVIPDGVKKISGAAFCGCTSLTSVTIPSSVEEIGRSAFSGCTGLTSVTVPEGVKTINYGVFCDCTGLTSIVLPGSISRIYDSAFQNCKALTDITIPECVEWIGYHTFQNCKKLASIHIPGKKVEKEAFQGCSRLKKVTLGENMTTLAESAFSGCKALTGITIPAAATQIGADAFAGCTALREVTFLGAPAQLHKRAFSGENMAFYTPAMSITQLPSTEYKQAAVRGFALRYGSGETLPEAYRADCIKYIKGQKKKLYPIAMEFPALLHVMLAEKIEPKGDLPDLIEQATSLNKPEVTAMLLDYQDRQLKPGEREKQEEKKLQREMDFMLTGALTATEAKKSWRYEKDEKGNLTILGYKGKEADVEVPTVIGKDPVTAIGDYAFSPNASPLTEAVRALRRGIRSIVLPEGITRIGWGAFEGCESLERLNVPAAVQKMGPCSIIRQIDKKSETVDNPFASCPSLRELTVDERNKRYLLRDGLLLKRSKGEEILLGRVGTVQGVCVIPKGTKKIPPECFRDCVDMTGVSLPEGLEKIGTDSFYGCQNLTECLLPSTVTAIEKRAFSGCAGLTELPLPTGLTTLGDGAFAGCKGLTHVTIPGSVGKLGDSWGLGSGVFSNCTGLVSLTICEGVTEIGEQEFYGCSSLTDLSIPASVTSMGDRIHYPFSGCSQLTAWNIHPDNPVYRGEGPLLLTKDGKTLLRCLVGASGVAAVPEGVTKIEYWAFEYCRKLTEIHLPASVCEMEESAVLADAWLKKIVIHPDNPVFRAEGPMVLRRDGLLLRCLECASGELTVPDGVTALGWGSFSGCRKLTRIVLPASVTEIDRSICGDTFHSCPKLVICAPAGSYAQKYAEATGHPFVAR